jgi:hypothetical protein
MSYCPRKDYASDDDPKTEHRKKMDLGLGEILRHFEEHFGKTASRILLGVVGFAVFGVCLRLIWDNLLHPVYNGIHWVVVGNHIQVPSVNTILAAVITGVSAALIFHFSMQLVLIYLNARLSKLVAEEKRIVGDAKALAALSKERAKEATDKIEEMKRMTTKLLELTEIMKTQEKRLNEAKNSSSLPPES